MIDGLSEKIKLLPTNPGVYVMLDYEGKIIYVGKAKNLKNRVSQYFHNSVKTDKVMAMVNNIADFYYIITKTEIDALTLENNLIKKNKPRYNILLKDDKTYPYIRVDLKEKFPRFTISRRLKKDGAKYFGPYMCGVLVGDVLEIINLAFKVRPCSVVIGDKPRKECLNYHIGKCFSPCSGKVSEEEYMEGVKGAVDFLNGNLTGVERILNEKMNIFAEREEFELALSYRDKLKMLEKIKEKRIVSISRFITADIVAIRTDKLYTSVNMLFARGGRIEGGKNFALDTSCGDTGEQLLEFLMQYYDKEKGVPDEIILNEEVDTELLEAYIKKELNKSCNVLVPKQGVRRQLATMAEENATDYLEKEIGKIKHKEDMTVEACKRLQEILRLKKYPRRMECYDISHISGVDKVGSMVVFIDGEADKTEYRRFKIKTVEGNNDFASLQEVLTRRLSKLATDEEERFPRPDLIIIDGGKGQLSSVKEVFDKYGCDIELISLAEREEEVYTLLSNQPVIIDRSDYALRMLQRIRDEAHRFAITYNRNLRSKRTLSSLLDEIEGLGKVKKKALIEKFKDLSGIISASKEELMQVEGIGEKQAEKIERYFKDGRI